MSGARVAHLPEWRISKRRKWRISLLRLLVPLLTGQWRKWHVSRVAQVAHSHVYARATYQGSRGGRGAGGTCLSDIGPRPPQPLLSEP